MWMGVVDGPAEGGRLELILEEWVGGFWQAEGNGEKNTRQRGGFMFL